MSLMLFQSIVIFVTKNYCIHSKRRVIHVNKELSILQISFSSFIKEAFFYHCRMCFSFEFLSWLNQFHELHSLSFNICCVICNQLVQSKRVQIKNFWLWLWSKSHLFHHFWRFQFGNLKAHWARQRSSWEHYVISTTKKMWATDETIWCTNPHKTP